MGRLGVGVGRGKGQLGFLGGAARKIAFVMIAHGRLSVKQRRNA
jgi:hypothetical protein